MESIFQRRKGQSAIEYLTTYGWMLLVIAIVGAAIFTTIQSQSEGPSEQEGFATGDLRIENFGVGNNGFQAEFRAATENDITITNVSLSEGDNTQFNSTNVSIPSTQTERVVVENVSEGDTEADITVTYDEEGLTGLSQTGTLSGLDVLSD